MPGAVFFSITLKIPFSCGTEVLILLFYSCPEHGEKVIKIFIFALLIAALPAALPGQVNTEVYRKDYQADGLYNTFGLMLGYRSGNSDDARAGTSFRSDLVAGSWHSMLIGSYEYGSALNVKNTNKGFLMVRFMRDLTRILEGEAYGQREFNEFINLNDRKLAGAGLRFNLDKILFDADSGCRRSFAVGASLMFEREDVKIPAGVKSIDRLRSSNYVSLQFDFPGRWAARVVTYFQIAPAQSYDYRLLSEGGMTFRLTNSFSMGINFKDRFDNDPPKGIGCNDFEINNSISFKF